MPIDLPDPSHRLVFRVSKPSELLKHLKEEQRQSADFIGVRLPAEIKTAFKKLVGGEPGMSEVVKRLIQAYLLHGDSENVSYLRIIADTEAREEARKYQEQMRRRKKGS